MGRDTPFLSDLSLGADQIARSEGVREQFASDFGTREGEHAMPDAVVTPSDVKDIAAILRAASERGIPVTPYAAGTSMEGHPVPQHGGVVLDMTALDRIEEIRPDDLQVDVQAGVIGEDINEAVEPHGLFLPPMPSSADISTIGGMIANDASGMRTVKYGEVREWVRELEVVLADGSIITPGTRARKTSSGYNLVDVLVGSEGTLGIVTRATMELAGLPAHRWGGRAVFETTRDAANAVADAVTSGVDVATIELLDPLSMQIANAYLDTGQAPRPTVFVEFHANQPPDEEVAFCRTVCESHALEAFEIAEDRRTFHDLWESRRKLGLALMGYDPDLEMLTVGDVTVPLSGFADFIEFAHDVADESSLLIPCFGHAGDGNVHYTVLVDPDDPEHIDRGREAARQIVEHALTLDGTVTGEHGIGHRKRSYMVDEHGERQVELMRRLKEAFDPNGILNPGTLLPDAG